MDKQALPLDPDARSTLKALLLPPEGYELDHALATAYSLDMETLVTIPLFAAGLTAEEIDKPVGIARIYQLGQRLTLLVQGDRVNLKQRGTNSRSLVRLVAEAVVPCSAGDGSFHPKLLVLKFKGLENPKAQLHRVVVATRNLTVDNSWDSVLVLDENPDGKPVRGLSEVVTGLAPFINESGHPAVALCKNLGRSLKDVPFQMLRGLDALGVHLFTPGGDVARHVLEQLRGDDILVVSPFVREKFLQQLVKQTPGDKENRWLVTRPVGVPKQAFEHFQVFQLAQGAVPGLSRRDVEEPEEPEQLRGLHAKLYLVSSKGAGTRIVITSANATNAGWSTNVEVAVSATANAKAYQVPSLLARSSGDAEERSFRDLLEEFTFSAVIQEDPEPAWERKARRVLARAVVTGKVDKGPPRALTVTLDLASDASIGLRDIEIEMHPFAYASLSRPMTLAGHRLRGRIEVPGGLELVPFIALKLTTRAEKPLELVLAMQLSGALDWSREDARKTLAIEAKPWLLRELLWHFGVRGGKKGGTDHGAGAKSGGQRHVDSLLPILEKVLLSVHGPRAKAEIETIDSLLAGVQHDVEYESLIRLWTTVKESLN